MLSSQYSAFISYRHQTPDQEIAKQLHRMIETYTIPSALRKGKARHPEKVFRDQEELPLSADLGKDIETALDNSEWLICICSPRYLESRWCQREVEYFVTRRGRDRVLTVLAEGEPKDSFPELLLYETGADGKRREREPLAADVRAGDLAGSLKKLKKEKFRILAPLVGSSFDGLYQRQRRRVLRNALTGAVAAVVLLGSFLAYALVQNGRIREQNQKIEGQNTELTEKNEQIEIQNTRLTEQNAWIEAQNLQLTEQNVRIETQNAELTEKNGQITEQNRQIREQNVRIEEERTAAARNECDLLIEKSIYYSSINRKPEAAKLALEARSVSETVEDYAREEIREALAVSCFMGDFAVEAELDFPGMLNYDPACFFSPDGTRIAVMNSRSGLTLCDTSTGERLWTSPPFSHDITSVHWKADGTQLVVTAQWGHTVCIIDAATGDHLKEARIPWAANAIFEGDNVPIAFAQGILRWETGVSDDNFPYVFQIDEDQHLTSAALQNDRFITLCQNFTAPRIFVQEVNSEYYSCVEMPGPAAISGYAVSPDGKWIFVHQYDQCFIMNLETDEIRWKTETAEKDSFMAGCAPVWSGNIILDCGTAYDAGTGEVLYTTGNRGAGVTPDGQYFYAGNAFYRLSDGSWFADVPGDLKAVSPAGDRLIVYQAVTYGRGLPGNPDVISPRTKKACLELAPGTGSQYTADPYEGSLLEIPDYTEPEHEEGTLFAFNDPYGTNATGYILSRNFFSPDGRYYLITNLGSYIPLFDLEKGNEPSARFYDFSVGDHVEAIDLSFSADSRYAAVAGAAGQIVVYELETGKIIRSFTDTYLSRSLSEVKFNRSGQYLMAADFSRSSFRVYSVANGQTLYIMHAVKEVASWGFDEETGDAVLCYTDGSALCARMFEDEETLYAYARERAE